MPVHCQPTDTLRPAEVMMDLHHFGVTLEMINLETELAATRQKLAAAEKRIAALHDIIITQIRSNRVSNDIMQDGLK